jgi:cytochrome c
MQSSLVAASCTGLPNSFSLNEEVGSMKNVQRVAVVSLITLIVFGSAMAQGQKGTPADAIAFVKKATEFIKANGTEKAFAEFRNAKGKFIDRDLYISVYDMKGFCVSHPDPKKDRKDLSNETDPTGKLVIKERLAIANTQGKGWCNYKGKALQGTEIVDKTVYVEKYEDYIVCCAVYGFQK